MNKQELLNIINKYVGYAEQEIYDATDSFIETLNKQNMSTFRKVKVNKIYYYYPVMIDVCDPKTTLSKGDKVKVINANGCPKANTMGHCHVERDGVFMGLVHCNSLSNLHDNEGRL